MLAMLSGLDSNPMPVHQARDEMQHDRQLGTLAGL